MNSTSTAPLPDLIKIDDITSGKIDPCVLYDEIERLKVEINILRNDMTMFLKTLGSIPPNQSQEAYLKLVYSKLKTVQISIKEYCNQYNKILPIINLSQIKLGHDVDIVQQGTSKSAPLEDNAYQTTSGLQNKGGRKPSANGKLTSLSNLNGNGVKTNNPPETGNVDQPILL